MSKEFKMFEGTLTIELVNGNEPGIKYTIELSPAMLPEGCKGKKFSHTEHYRSEASAFLGIKHFKEEDAPLKFKCMMSHMKAFNEMSEAGDVEEEDEHGGW